MGFRASASAVVTKISDEPSNLSFFTEACVMQTLFGHGLQWSELKLLATSRVHYFDKFWSEMSFAWTEARSHEYRTASLPTMNTALLQVLQLALQHFLAFLQMWFIASISPASLWAWFYSSSLELLRRSYCTYPHSISLIASTQFFLYNQQTVNLLHILFRKIGHLCWNR